MEEPTIDLCSERQRNFFGILKQQRLPKFFDQLFDHPELTLDFLQALLKLRVESPEDEWSRARILPRVRKQALAMDFAKLGAFMEKAVQLTGSKIIDFNAFLIPFGSPAREVVHAVAVFDFTLDSILTEDILLGENPRPQLLLLPLLIAAQRETRTWALLAEGVQQGQREAWRVFKKLISFWAIVQVVPKFTRASSFDFEMAASSILRIPEGMFRESGDPENPVESIIPVPDDCVFACNRFYRKLAEEQKGRQEQVAKLIFWFREHEVEFQQLADRLWQEINHNARYGLRPNGRDVVKIEVKSLYNNGYRYLKFFPSPIFPQCTVRFFITVLDIGLRIAIDRTLRPGPLAPVREDLDPHGYHATTDKLQQFIALHSFWKIATGQILRTRPTHPTVSEQSHQELERRKFLVRPHFRWLVPGYQPSDRALQRSFETFGYNPPTGKTFVKSDPEADMGVGTEPFAPILTYTDRDLEHPREDA